MYPVPSEERSLRERRWLGTSRKVVDPDAVRGVVHENAERRAADQSKFTDGQHFFRSLLDPPPPRPAGLRHLPEPRMRDRSPRKRCRADTTQLSRMDVVEAHHSLFPAHSGMSVRPAVVEAQQVLSSLRSLNDVWPPAPSEHHGKKIFPEVVQMQQAHSSGKGDASMQHLGVKKVLRMPPMEEAARSHTSLSGGGGAPPSSSSFAAASLARESGGAVSSLSHVPRSSLVPGFSGFGIYEPPQRGQGKALVQPEKFDPLGFKARYGREHYGSC